MKLFSRLPYDLRSLLFLAALPVRVFADNILQTTGFDNCGATNASITVQNLTLSFDAANNIVTFDVAAESTVVQNVTASLEVYAYGKLVYSRDLDPCDSSTYVQQLCPGKKDDVQHESTYLTRHSAHRKLLSDRLIHYPSGVRLCDSRRSLRHSKPSRQC